MKKMKLSLAAVTLVLAIAGTATAYAGKVNTKVPLCSDFDPEGIICVNGSDLPCCEDDFGNIYYYAARN